MICIFCIFHNKKINGINHINTGEYFQRDNKRQSILMGSKFQLTPQKVLYDTRIQSMKFLNDDSILFNTKHDLANQRVIKSDIDRTRTPERIHLPSFCDYCESILTYYCKENNFKYKQGLNEIIGPFVLIKAKISISFSNVYNIFACFVDKFLTNYYIEDEFYSLQSSLKLIWMILIYQAPDIANIMDNASITPMMFATSWLLTIFAK